MMYSLMDLLRKLFFGALVVMVLMIYGDRFLPDGIRFLRVVSDQSVAVTGER
ncbi:MAG: hypothetical protein H7829_00550 [Magnetococcus sp. THC-1_WYH]